GGPPRFEHEPNYPKITFPDSGYQLLALFRYWNIVQYWAPYRDLIDKDWDQVLREFIPRLACAKGADPFKLELIAFIATVQDTHANLWGSLHIRPPVGGKELPLVIRFIDGEAVIAGFSGKAA